jgi:hypothetical protein
MVADVTRVPELLRQAVALANDRNPSNFDEWLETARVALRVCFDNAGAVPGSVVASTDDDDAEATETAAAA